MPKVVDVLWMSCERIKDFCTAVFSQHFLCVKKQGFYSSFTNIIQMFYSPKYVDFPSLNRVFTHNPQSLLLLLLNRINSNYRKSWVWIYR